MDVGVIGTGVMGRNHVRVYSDMKAAKSVWVYDLDTDVARDVAEQNNVNYAKSMEELLHKVDAVSLCVPTPYHCTIAKEVLAAGVHMLVEKPICLTAAEGAELLKSIPDGCVVGVGHIERFNPIIAEIKRIVKDPLYVEINRHNPASSRVTGSSVVEDLMIHDIDLVFNALFGGGYRMNAFGSFDVCAALFNFGETPVYLSASRKASKKIRLIRIEEEDFTIEGDFMSQEVYVYRKPEHYHQEAERYVQENITEKVMVSKVEPLRTELLTFIGCARMGTPFPVTPEQGVANVRICEKITGTMQL
ncbi:Gfo/Idh/MocA family protein [Methanogenium organophilum]|uniref:Gfo/Idh/MocA family oxidoreductase n=1 Tax=Methanogenium organophilum TaxID=2199 RepID=A0A9X9T8E9_METOG|nr:Gfo/Idh/MocA family oxidoreductase [Methanogenium organophilum]WAI01376.1 Gfo/Idh/MocA family oxidoreductase [Methanogenium organophilum]